ncbi:TPA: DUF2235 domain-containing protein [Neisseria gonorrhoeae]
MLEPPAGVSRRAFCLADRICLFGFSLGAYFKVIRALVIRGKRV